MRRNLYLAIAIILLSVGLLLGQAPNPTTPTPAFSWITTSTLTDAAGNLFIFDRAYSMTRFMPMPPIGGLTGTIVPPLTHQTRVTLVPFRSAARNSREYPVSFDATHNGRAAIYATASATTVVAGRRPQVARSLYAIVATGGALPAQLPSVAIRQNVAINVVAGPTDTIYVTDQPVRGPIVILGGAAPTTVPATARMTRIYEFPGPDGGFRLLSEVTLP